MASHDPTDIAARGDALVCRSAVLLLRARHKAGVAGEDLAPDADRLLSALGLELETNAESIPTALRRAAVQLAEHLVQRSSILIPRDAIGDEPVVHPRPRIEVRVRAAGRALARTTGPRIVGHVPPDPEPRHNDCVSRALRGGIG